MKICLILEIISQLLICVSGLAWNISCKSPWIKRGDGYVCYSNVQPPAAYDDAKLNCAALNMTMLTIQSNDENDAVKQLLTTALNPDSWLGTKQIHSPWKWLDGNTSLDQGCYLNPNLNDMELKQTLNENSASTCTDICFQQSYPFAALQKSNICFCGDSFGTYGQLNAECRSYCPGSSTNYCGGTTSEMVLAVNGSFSYWSDGQPNNNPAGLKFCAVVNSKGDDFRWQAAQCFDSNGYICEIFAHPLNCLGAGCSMISSGRCFCVMDTLLSYFQARLECRKLGGDVVMPKTLEDNHYVGELLRNMTLKITGFWIGMAKWTWFWETGDEFLYTNWAPQQPSSLNQECATIKAADGMWVPLDCSNTSSRYYICQTSNETKTYNSTAILSTRRTARISSSITMTTTANLASGKDGNAKAVVATPATNSVTLSPGALCAIIVGGIAFFILNLVVTAVGIRFCRNRRKRQPPDGENNTYVKTENELEEYRPTYFFGIEPANKATVGMRKGSAWPELDPKQENPYQMLYKDKSSASKNHPAGNTDDVIGNPNTELSNKSEANTNEWDSSQQVLVNSEAPPDVIPKEPINHATL